MKPSITILALLLPVTAIAQNYPGMGGAGMSQQDMQNMMQQMQEMQTCMQGIDMSKFETFEQRGRAVETEVKSLCASGKRDAAQDKVTAFAREVSDNPDIQKMMKCSEGMRDTMAGMPYMGQANPADKTDAAASHVCDM